MEQKRGKRGCQVWRRVSCEGKREGEGEKKVGRREESESSWLERRER